MENRHHTVWARQLGKKNESGEKESFYTDIVREDLVNLIHCTPKIALDIGCNTGGTFLCLKKRFPHCKTIGVELNQHAAQIAKTRLDVVLTGNLENIDFAQNGINPHSIDFLLLADVLEHLSDPWHALLHLKKWLSPVAEILISIPNIRYLPLMDDLANGYFRYADFGVLDITHLRFFTRQELRKMLNETGYTVEELIPAFDSKLLPLFEEYKKQLPCTVKTAKMSLHNVDLEELTELFSGQFIVRARPWESHPLIDYKDFPSMSCGFWQGEPSLFEDYLTFQKTPAHEKKAYPPPANPPLCAVFINALEEGEAALSRTLESLTEQIENNFLIFIVGKKAPQIPLGLHARALFFESPRFCASVEKIRKHPQNTALFSIFLNAGDVLMPEALALLNDFQKKEAFTVAFCDEAYTNPQNEIVHFSLKPEFSLDYFLSSPNALGQGIFWKNTLLNRLPFEGRIPTLLKCLKENEKFCHLPAILFSGKKREEKIPRSFLTQFAQEKNCTFQEGFLPHTFFLYPKLKKKFSVAWITPMPQTLEECRRVFENSFLPTSQSPNLEVVLLGVVDQLEESAWRYLEGIGDMHLPNVHFLVQTENFLKTAHQLIVDCNADFILLLDSACRLTSPVFLEKWLSLAQDEAIATVAPNLILADGSLLGNAMVLGVKGIAAGLGFGLKERENGAPLLENRHQVPQNPSAVNGMAQIFRREVYLKNPWNTDLSLNAAAVDWCLKQSPLRILWRPDLRLIVENPKKHLISDEESDFLIQTHEKKIAQDPFYSRHLSYREAFYLNEDSERQRVRLSSKNHLPRVLAMPGDKMGCGFIRVIDPILSATRQFLVDGELPQTVFKAKGGMLPVFLPNPLEMLAKEVRALFVQRIRDTWQEWVNLKQIKKISPQTRLVYDLDDLFTHVPQGSPHKKEIPPNLKEEMKRILEVCDCLTVSTLPLKKAYQNWCKEVRVIPNRLSQKRWENLNFPSKPQNGKLRVGYSGSLSHSVDLPLIEKLVQQTAHTVNWIFMGVVPEKLRPFLAEYHPFVPTGKYPQSLANLNLDVALAPLKPHSFNAAKSNLKILEYGILGYAVIATDFGPYQEDPNHFPITRVENSFDSWLGALEKFIHNRDAVKEEGEALKNAVLRFGFLENHLNDWLSAWLG